MATSQTVNPNQNKEMQEFDSETQKEIQAALQDIQQRELQQQQQQSGSMGNFIKFVNNGEHKRSGEVKPHVAHALNREKIIT
jgi:hypothetical protein